MYRCILILLVCATSKLIAVEIPLDNFIAPSEFKNMIISPDGKKIAAIIEGDIRDMVIVLNLKTMKKLSSFEFGKNRKVFNLSWANKDYIVMNISRVVGNLDNKARLEGVYLSKYNGNGRKYIYGIQKGLDFASLYDPLERDPKYIIVRTARGFSKHNIKSGRSNTIVSPKANIGYYITGRFLDTNHKVRMFGEINNDLDRRYYFQPKNQLDWQQIDLPDKGYKILITFFGYSSDPDVVYVKANIDNPVMGLYEFNINTGKYKNIYQHEYVDIDNSINDENEYLVGTEITPGYEKSIWIKPQSSYVKIFSSLQASFPGQSIGITSNSLDNNKYIIHSKSDKNAGKFYLYDKKMGEIKYLASTYSKLKDTDLSDMKPVSFKARDGVSLHGYLTLPKNKEAKNLPLIVNPHGGPHGVRDYWGFNPEIQLLANRGYAVLQVNFRGSGGYGTEFIESGYDKWGREMQNDITDATLWAVEQGYADKERLCIYGGSYGGYAALQAVVREPDLYKCAIGYVGVYDLTQLKSCGDSNGSKIAGNLMDQYIGTDKEVHVANSPAFNVGKIKADLFIAHGKDDVRVPMCQGKALKNALEKAGKEFIWMARDEGHGYQKMKNKKDFYSTMLTFFDKSIGH